MSAKRKKGKLGERRSASASDILYRRYIRGRPEREKSLRDVTAAMSLGEYLRELRERKEVTQQQLADAIGTKRSAISRFESADYDGHSIELLCRIATALHGKLVVRIDTVPADNGRELVLSGK